MRTSGRNAKTVAVEACSADAELDELDELEIFGCTQGLCMHA
jgi:hypothetical protein